MHMTSPSIISAPEGDGISHALARLVLDIAGQVPPSSEHPAAQAQQAALDLARQAAQKAAMTSGSLALAPGPFGLVTLLPDLLAVWKIQSQLVSDIAAVYGQSASLTREHMLYCLFKHSAAQAVRDLVVRAGERWLIRQASGAVIQAIARRIGQRLSEKMLATGASRLVPFLGAVGVGAYAYYDTRRVAESAMELFAAASAAQAE